MICFRRKKLSTFKVDMLNAQNLNPVLAIHACLGDHTGSCRFTEFVNGFSVRYKGVRYGWAHEAEYMQ